MTPEPPWDDVKVAFGLENDEALWEAWENQTLSLPEGWSLDETDSSGARSVAVFRALPTPRPEDGERVIKELIRIGARMHDLSFPAPDSACHALSDKCKGEER